MPHLTSFDWIVLLTAVLTVAFFYSSVGHGGATGYLAALALLGVAPAAAKVAVLVTNVLVAGIAWWRFQRAGHADGKLLLWFAVASIPAAFFGSRIPIILGAVLTVAGLVLLFRSRWQTETIAVRKCFWPLALLTGAGLGLLAGLTGIGGGVFLSPVLYLCRWAKPKTTGGIAAGFIVLNSLAGLAGAGAEQIRNAGPLLWLTLPAVGGALLGASRGANRWSSVTFSRVLAAVLLFAGGKLLLSAAG